MEKNSIEIDGAGLKRLLRRTRMSAADLAVRMGCHVQTIYRLQQDRGATTLTTLDDLAQVVGEYEVSKLIVSKIDRDDFLSHVRVPATTE